ncbi:MAG TPA: hypothetical protein VNE39_07265 [Planctomycetota bacterium]|nr:hypothetical protein [Planctomycetota bacterium]
MHYFDYESLAREAGIPGAKLAAICDRMRREFPRDDMMYELHVLRACMAVKAGRVRLEDVLRVEADTVGAAR